MIELGEQRQIQNGNRIESWASVFIVNTIEIMTMYVENQKTQTTQYVRQHNFFLTNHSNK